MAAQFINQQNLAAMLNPQTANLGQLIGAPLAQGLMASGQQNREDRLMAEQQQAQAQAVQDKENMQREAAFSASLLGVSDEMLPTVIQQGIQSGQFNDDFIEELGQISAVPSMQRDKFLTSTLQSEGFGSLIPKAANRKTATLSKGDRLVDADSGQTIAEGAKDLSANLKQSDNLFSKINSTRDQIRKADPSFIKLEDAWGRINASSVDPSPAGDLALIFNYMKILDPGSTVREGEFATAQNAAGVDERAFNLYNQVLEGTRLNPRQRKDFVGRAGKLFKTAESTRNRRIKPILDTAKRFGVNREDVLGRPFVTQGSDSQDSGAADVNSQALDWANQNPNDPRAAAILQKLGAN